MVRRRCKIAVFRQSKLLEMFEGAVSERTAAELVGVNRHSETLFYHKLREIIAVELEDESWAPPLISDECSPGFVKHEHGRIRTGTNRNQIAVRNDRRG